ncbi:MAG: Clp protease ATP binding subunit [Candidatus Kaiserbacteria bacterium GW2011_GWA2_49_19]|uniref:Clp protease ATP binding subunit n=1 Tax=Candidatus Kaiserbacteria bacterium GW2011_GWA2_49_19 TaxID=1618669 RepID=A0A0G1VSJ9_9BACT|nr:MAG: Clp protease ATP binding subunit [Candidatus Kaiserbacteria bacterium GW2011_GWA2_49_19]
MNQDELKSAVAVFYPALVFDRVIGREIRAMVEKILDWVLVVFIVLVLMAHLLRVSDTFSAQSSSFVNFLENWQPAFLGMILVTLALCLVMRAFQAFYDSYYFFGLSTILPEADLSSVKPVLTFEAAEAIFLGQSSGDFTGGFIRSSLGRYVFNRLGVSQQSLERFMSDRAHVFLPSDFKFSRQSATEPLGFGGVAAAIVAADAELFKFLALHAVTPKDFAGAADWMERTEIMYRHSKRFWGRDVLGRIRGIGKDWSVGAPYALLRFAHDITETGMLSQNTAGPEEHLSEKNALEAVLARTGEANALLVADEGEEALDIVFALGTKISHGNVLPPLEHKRIFLFDVNSFIAFAKDKAKFESELLHILNESVRAGHIILVVGDFPNFIESAKSLGSDLIAILDPYLTSTDFQLVAMTNPGAFHQGLEGNSKIVHRFEKILVKDSDEKSVMKVLEDKALVEESKSRIFFTYQSISAVAEGVKRYFTEGVSSNKAFHLLAEIVPDMMAKKKTFVERSDVLDLIEAKTGIPTGEVTTVERDKLLNLENILRERVIGQDEAVKAISGALRRARSDITNPERPMGSFLFLGPTGVGKTETTKALAATFFGKEDAVIRLDMSEYRTDDALKRLIGSFEDGKAGVFSSRLREQSYGVLLLDEFEKTNKEVLDLFLQILDEGFFSDSSGKRVNARNLIIIATSNAGSDLVWNLMRQGKKLVDEKQTIITEIINRGIFKPELLNRFDGVIMFHPLSIEDLQKIAALMLKKLQKRLAAKGIELVVNDALLKAVTAAGTDPEFGARPMNRAIQEKVEQIVAEKIISGKAPSGSKVELTEAELA